MSAYHSFTSTTNLLRTASWAEDTLSSNKHAPTGSTTPVRGTSRPGGKKAAKNGVVPLGAVFLITMCVLASLFFIGTMSLVFVGGRNVVTFKSMLDELASGSPGIILLGEDVDVDVDEPSISIRWAFVACGEAFVLPGSQGVHGSEACGLPSVPLDIYIDSGQTPVGQYRPAISPFDRDTGKRRMIQALTRFDDDHVLDVHEANLYPFDTYRLSSTVRAVNFATNETMQIRKLSTVDVTTSFTVTSTDADTYNTLSDGTQVPTREIEMIVRREPTVRLYAMMLWIVNWILTHVTIGLVVLAVKSEDIERAGLHSLYAFAIVLAIPQIRNAMPDAPDLDGVLIDIIGYFPQTIFSGAAAILLLVVIALRELKEMQVDPTEKGDTVAHETEKRPSTFVRGHGLSIKITDPRDTDPSLPRAEIIDSAALTPQSIPGSPWSVLWDTRSNQDGLNSADPLVRSSFESAYERSYRPFSEISLSPPVERAF